MYTVAGLKSEFRVHYLKAVLLTIAVKVQQKLEKFAACHNPLICT